MFMAHAKIIITTKDMQGLGCVCLNRAMMIKENKSLDVDTWIYWTNYSLRREQYIELDSEVKRVIKKHNLKDMPTVMDYFLPLWKKIKSIFCINEGEKEGERKEEKEKGKEEEDDCSLQKIKWNCYYDLAAKSLDYSFVKYLPSDIVIATLKNSILKYNSEEIPKNKDIDEYVDKYINTSNRKDILEIMNTPVNTFDKDNKMRKLYLVKHQVLDPEMDMALLYAFVQLVLLHHE